MHKVRTTDLDRLYVGLVIERGLSAASVRQVHTVIRRVLRRAVRWGWIAIDPAADASPRRIPKPDIAPPDVEQVGELLRYANEHQPELGQFLHLAATTGARRGELCALRWENIDHAVSALTIGRAIVAIQGGLVEKDTKTHAARRIALDPGTLAVLHEHRAAAEARAHAVEVELRPTAYLFSAEPDGSIPRAPTTVTKWFRSTCDALVIDTAPARPPPLRRHPPPGRWRTRPHRLWPPRPRQRRHHPHRLRPLPRGQRPSRRRCDGRAASRANSRQLSGRRTTSGRTPSAPPVVGAGRFVEAMKARRPTRPRDSDSGGGPGTTSRAPIAW